MVLSGVRSAIVFGRSQGYGPSSAVRGKAVPWWTHMLGAFNNAFILLLLTLAVIAALTRDFEAAPVISEHGTDDQFRQPVGKRRLSAGPNREAVARSKRAAHVEPNPGNELYPAGRIGELETITAVDVLEESLHLRSRGREDKTYSRSFSNLFQ